MKRNEGWKMRAIEKNLWFQLAVAGSAAAGIAQGCSDPFESCAERRSCPLGGAAGMTSDPHAGAPSEAGQGGISAVTGGAGGRDSAVHSGAGLGGEVPVGGNGGGTTPDAGSAGEGGAGGAASECTIGSTIYAREAVNPSNECQVCDVAEPNAWSARADGTACGDGQVCNAGKCESGCWIDSTFYAIGDTNPQNPCQFCAGGTPTSWGSTPVSICARAIDAGNEHTCLVANGWVRCWGHNNHGQVGNGTYTDAHIPWTVDIPTRASAVALASGSSCALAGDSLHCWGNNEGLFGNGTSAESQIPVQVVSSGVSSVGSSFFHSCVLKQGVVYCSGFNIRGQLGDGTTENRTSFVQVASLTGVSQIAAGDYHNCAIMGGKAWCWGMNENGQLGNDSTSDSHVPVQVKGLSGVTAMSAGYAFTCAIADAAAYCWGENARGQIGNNSNTDVIAPVRVHGLNGRVTAIAAGGFHACAIVDGGAWCWGPNEGRVGDGTTTDRWMPVAVVGMERGVTAISAGGTHTCAVKHGQVYCWGSNKYGQLGNNSTTASLVPVKVAF
ncbi:MAG: RCC1 domain-containing protein [Myxococcota bacterium]